MTKYVCTICGYVAEGKIPDICPVCKAPAAKFAPKEVEEAPAVEAAPAKKYVCTICGYVAEGEIPEACPVCKAPASKFMEQSSNNYVTEHVVGIAKDAPEDIIQGLRENFNGECSEVGMYLAMSRVADREGYPEVAEAWKRYAFEEAEHAAKFAELLGEVLTDSTKKNLQMRVDAECGACAGKMDLAKKAKQLNLDAIHDTVHEMAKDEARHGRGMQGLLDRYFK